jgi:hypothetical protein
MSPFVTALRSTSAWVSFLQFLKVQEHSRTVQIVRDTCLYVEWRRNAKFAHYCQDQARHSFPNDRISNRTSKLLDKKYLSTIVRFADYEHSFL